MPAVIRALNINTYSDAHCYQCTHTVIHIHRPTAYLTLQIHTIQFHCFPELYRHTFPFHCCSPHYRNTHSHVHCHQCTLQKQLFIRVCRLHCTEKHIEMPIAVLTLQKNIFTYQKNSYTLEKHTLTFALPSLYARETHIYMPTVLWHPLVVLCPIS